MSSSALAARLKAFVAMSRWSVEHRAFDMKVIFKNNDSVVVTQWIFRRHFNIHRNDSVPRRNTPEDIERVRQAFVTSPRRSASRNTISLRTCGAPNIA
jgi:hypothetical protein